MDKETDVVQTLIQFSENVTPSDAYGLDSDDELDDIEEEERSLLRKEKEGEKGKEEVYIDPKSAEYELLPPINFLDIYSIKALGDLRKFFFFHWGTRFISMDNLLTYYCI